MHPFYALTAPRYYYPFRFIDPVTGKWMRARYVAERHVIAARYDRWEITGPPEVRLRRGDQRDREQRRVRRALAETPIKVGPDLRFASWLAYFEGATSRARPISNE